MLRPLPDFRPGNLPSALRETRGAAQVSFGMTVPGLPERVAESGSYKDAFMDLVAGTAPDASILGSASIGPKAEVVLLDKSKPHATNDLMLLTRHGGPHPGLFDRRLDMAQGVGQTIARFAGIAANTGLYPVVSWNYDPDTGSEREGFQSQKSFHAHLLARTEAELLQAGTDRVPLSSLSVVDQRRLCDEAGLLATVVLDECLAEKPLNSVRLLEPTSSPLAAATTQLEIPAGWSALNGKTFWADMREVHLIFRKLYLGLRDAALVPTNGDWRTGVPRSPRDTRRRVDAIDLPMAPSTRDMCVNYLDGLRPRLMAHFLTAPNPKLAPEAVDHVLPLAGLAYGTQISSCEGRLFAYLRGAVFSSLGSASVSVVNDGLAVARRGTGRMTDAQFEARRSWQQETVDGLIATPEIAPTGPLIEQSVHR